MKVRVGGRFNW